MPLPSLGGCGVGIGAEESCEAPPLSPAATLHCGVGCPGAEAASAHRLSLFLFPRPRKTCLSLPHSHPIVLLLYCYCLQLKAFSGLWGSQGGRGGLGPELCWFAIWGASRVKPEIGWVPSGRGGAEEGAGPSRGIHLQGVSWVPPSEQISAPPASIVLFPWRPCWGSAA